MKERCEAFAAAFPRNRAAWPYVGQEQGRDVAYGTWVIGNDYRNKSRLYGAYPNGYLGRLLAMFPDVMRLAAFESAPPVLHAFAGKVEPDRRWLRLDLKAERQPDIVGNVYDVAELTPLKFRLIPADPPYTRADGKKYGTGPVDRLRATAALAGVAMPAGHLAWLDTCWPMHSKLQWLTVGRITVIRSTNHRVRLLTLFERVA